jgi:hypothetical protein
VARRDTVSLKPTKKPKERENLPWIFMTTCGRDLLAIPFVKGRRPNTKSSREP